MTEILPVKNGFVLTVGHSMNQSDLAHLAKELEATTGEKWFIICDTDSTRVKVLKESLERVKGELAVMTLEFEKMRTLLKKIESLTK